MRDVMSEAEIYLKAAPGAGRTALMVVSGVAPWTRSARARSTNAWTGQRDGWPERPCPMRSLRTPFFCCLKVRVTNVEARRSGSGHVKRSNAREPIQN